MVNQKDIAKRAGVSSCTVSRYINKKGYISKELQKKIQKSINELNYSPNLIARSLKIRKTKTIGFIFPDIENPFFIRVIKKAEEIAYKNGYSVILCNTENDPEKEIKYLQALKGKFVDGYLYISSFKDRSVLRDILNNEKIVSIDRMLNTDNEICIKLNNKKAVKLGTEYLLELGHRNIAIIGVPLTIDPGLERLEGFKEIMSEYKIKINNDYIGVSDFSIESSYHIAKNFLNLTNKPTAIFPFSYFSTISTLIAIKELNLRIPEDISIIGFDDLIWMKLLTPPLTIIEQPYYRFGEIGVEILIKMIEGEKTSKEIITLEPSLIIRQSCKEIKNN